MNVRQFAACLTAGVLALKSVFSARSEESAAQGMDSMKKLVRSRFPSVRQLSTASLASWLSETNRPKPILIDVRTDAEYQVSHLPGAVRLDPGADTLPKAWAASKTAPAVLYCSVGYRSSQMADRLANAGWTNVFNLEGSIFDWANEGRAIEAGGKPARAVHPYNTTFGKLLKPELMPPAVKPLP